ncbi:MAG: hypothetical protein WC967_13440 [Balneolaceae bacterium]
MNTIDKLINIATGQHIAGYITNLADNSITFYGLTDIELERFVSNADSLGIQFKPYNKQSGAVTLIIKDKV